MRVEDHVVTALTRKLQCSLIYSTVIEWMPHNGIYHFMGHSLSNSILLQEVNLGFD